MPRRLTVQAGDFLVSHFPMRMILPARDSPRIRDTPPAYAGRRYSVKQFVLLVLLCGLPGSVSAEFADATRQQAPILGRETTPVLPVEQTLHGRSFALLTLDAELASGNSPELSPVPATAVEQPQVSESLPTVSPLAMGPAVEQTQELTPEEKERRKNYLSLGWILLIGVALLGGILLLFVLYLGSSARRLARKPLPPAPLRDPLWYLRPEKSSETATVSGRKDSSGDSLNGADSPSQQPE